MNPILPNQIILTRSSHLERKGTAMLPGTTSKENIQKFASGFFGLKSQEDKDCLNQVLRAGCTKATFHHLENSTFTIQIPENSSVTDINQNERTSQKTVSILTKTLSPTANSKEKIAFKNLVEKSLGESLHFSKISAEKPDSNGVTIKVLEEKKLTIEKDSGLDSKPRKSKTTAREAIRKFYKVTTRLVTKHKR